MLGKPNLSLNSAVSPIILRLGVPFYKKRRILEDHSYRDKNLSKIAIDWFITGVFLSRELGYNSIDGIWDTKNKIG
jgi:hypothetical protein